MTLDPDSFYLSQPEPAQSCLMALRSIVLQQDESVTETKKYGMPCFCIGKKAFCYLWKDKKSNEPYILFVEGRRIDHPALEKGNRTRMKILRVNPAEDLHVALIEKVLSAAVTLCKNQLISNEY